MQQKSGLKYMVLEKKITAMREELDVKDAQMHDIVKVTQSSDRGIFETNMIQIQRLIGLISSVPTSFWCFIQIFFLEITGPLLKVLSDKKLSDVRNVIKDQNMRIARLERQITQMRQRREWGDVSSVEDSQSKHSRTSSSSSSVSSSSSSESSESRSVSHGSRSSASEKSITR